MKRKNKPQPVGSVNINITASTEEMKAVTADLVNFETSGGHVTMNFLQTISTSKNRDGVEEKMGLLMSRVTFSWEYFAELTQQMVYQMKVAQKAAEERHSAAVKYANNFGDPNGENDDE